MATFFQNESFLSKEWENPGEHEHKTGIYFFRKTRIMNQKWGTASPIKYEDPEFRFPVALKTYGNFSCQIMEPAQFFQKVVGGRDLYSISDLRETRIRNYGFSYEGTDFDDATKQRISQISDYLC